MVEKQSGNTNEEQKPNPEKPIKVASSVLLPEVEKRLDRLEKYISIIAEPIAKRKDPSRSWWERFADSLETSVPSRIVIGLGAVLTFFSLAGILATAWGVHLQYLSMEEERLARAWQLLATTGLGNGGKVDAIHFIHSKDETLSGINIGGHSKSTGPYLNSLNLTDASVWDGNWNFAFLDNSKITSTNFGRMQLQESSVYGTWDTIQVVWTDATKSNFHLNAGSSVEIDTSIFDQSYFTIRMGNTLVGLEGLTSESQFTVHESGEVILGGEDARKQAIIAAGEVISFRNTSLRCALIPLEYAVNFSFNSTNVSGAYLGSPYYFGEAPESSIANLPDKEWKKFKGAWYFADNPPKGVPETILAKYFTSFERQRLAAQCSRFEPRASKDTPLSLLDGVDGIETACVSLAKMPTACETPYPSNSIFMLETSGNEEYSLEKSN